MATTLEIRNIDDINYAATVMAALFTGTSEVTVREFSDSLGMCIFTWDVTLTDEQLRVLKNTCDANGWILEGTSPVLTLTDVMLGKQWGSLMPQDVAATPLVGTGLYGGYTAVADVKNRSQSDPGMLAIYTTDGSDDDAAYVQSGPLSFKNHRGSWSPHIRVNVELTAITAARIYVGLTDGVAATPLGSTDPDHNRCGFRLDTDDDASWWTTTRKKGVGEEKNDTGLTGLEYGFDIYYDEAAGEVYFNVYNLITNELEMSTIVHDTNIPLDSVFMQLYIGVQALEIATKTMYIYSAVGINTMGF